jgi:hypothetical protein
MGEEKSEPESAEKTKKICACFGIQTNAHIDEDKKIIDNLLDAIFINNQIFKTPAKLVINTCYNKGENMEWIFVAAAFSLVGMFLYKQSIDKKQEPIVTNESAIKEAKEQATPQPIPAGLCLIVPASIASKFSNHQYLIANDLMHLIDNASYFICTLVKDAELNDKKLALMMNEPILPDSMREVYLRINIANGRNMIDKKMPYYLKINLPEDVQGDVKQFACLQDLSGLEKFNRV